MDERRVDCLEEFRLSVRWVEYLPLVLGLGLLLTSVVIADPTLRLHMQFGGVGLGALSALGGLLGRRRSWLGAVFNLSLLTSCVLLLSWYMGTSALLPLLALPPALAMLTLGSRPGLIMAGVETALVLLVSGDWVVTTTTLIVIWGIISFILFIPARTAQTAMWIDAFYEQALALRREAFAHEERLQQTLRDLENANRQLAQSSRRMAALRAIAEDAQRTKTMFLAKVSHEFRTPLNMIIGLAELMTASPQIYAMEIPPEMEADLEVILRNCRHLSSMVDDVLDLTRAESGRIMLHREWVSLTDIIDEAVTAVRPLTEKKGVALRVSLQESLPEVYCDRTRIRQVMLNLLSNAARFTDTGSITVESIMGDGYVETRVIDTGKGISPEDIDSIFEPFSQGHGGLWLDRGGSGLGLSISRHFVRLHHGDLWVESEPGVGSTFSFRLPIRQPLEPVTRPDRYIRPDWVWREATFRTERAGVAEQAQRRRVVCYESMPHLSRELRRYSEAIDIIHIDNWPELVKELNADPPDVLILNVPLSEEPSAMVDAISDHVRPGTVTIVCSVPVPQARVTEAGATGYLVKPVTLEDLRTIVSQVHRPARRVLIVDDDPEVQQLLRRMLKLAQPGVEVVTTSSGRKALDLVLGSAIDLVLLDVVMPEMNGWEWLRRVRADYRTADLPVYMISARDPIDELPRAQSILVFVKDGVSVTQLLRFSLELSSLLLTPEQELDPVPPRTDADERVSTRIL